jgi:hypothetical protein
MAIWFVEARGGLPRPQTKFAFSEAFYELVLFGLVPLFLTVATIWILWHVLEKIDEVIDIRFFLTFILVAVPFVMLIYFGGTIILYSQMMAVSGSSRQVLLPLTPLSSVNMSAFSCCVGN